jgi:oligopeptide transport system permease protein
MARFLLIALCALLVFTIIQPILPGQKDPNEIFNDYDKYGKATPMKNKGPSAEYWFGTDAVGHDLWSRIWSGTRTSLLMALIVASINCVVGITVGIMWGYVRKLDALLTEIYNIMDNIPRTIILILMSYIMKPGMLTMIVSMCIVGWLGMARFIRNQVVMIRDRDYNLASRCLGTPITRIATKNILPFMTSVIVTLAATEIPSYISYEVFLSYIGMGLSEMSLGKLIEASQAAMQTPGWQIEFWAPVTVSAIITVVLYVVGQNLGDASDPRTHM